MRSLVRSVALALALAPLAAPALLAQRGRLTVTPTVGRAMMGTLFEHGFYSSAFGGTTEYDRWRRLELRGASVVGTRIAVGMWRGWTAVAEGSYGRTALFYQEVKLYPCTGVCTLGGPPTYTRQDDASVTALALGVERLLAFEEGGLAISAGLGASLQRLGLDRLPPGTCRAGQGEVFCGPDDPWESHYWIPGAQGSLALRVPVTRSLGLEARGALSVGRANIAGFRRGEVFDPETGAEPIDGEPLPPGSRRVRGRLVSLGLSYRP